MLTHGVISGGRHSLLCQVVLDVLVEFSTIFRFELSVLNEGDAVTLVAEAGAVFPMDHVMVDFFVGVRGRKLLTFLLSCNFIGHGPSRRLT